LAVGVEHAAAELTLAARRGEVFGQHSGAPRALRVRQSHRIAQRSADEHLERHQCADRVAGQGDDRGAVHGARALRHARLHGDLDEIDFAAERILDDLVGARADAAGGDDQVGLTGVAVQDITEHVDVITGHRGRHDFRSRVPYGGGEHHCIGFVDLARL
jgi:hypothetical protein